MTNLIKALQIFCKYKDLEWPTICEHDVLYIAGIHQTDVSEDDQKELETLGFDWSISDNCFVSHKYGSA